MTEDFTIEEILEELTADSSWCGDKAQRSASVNALKFFLSN